MQQNTQGGSMSAQLNDIKVCPVCGAKVFSDMKTCFGCLYEFDDEKPANNEVEEVPDIDIDIDIDEEIDDADYEEVSLVDTQMMCEVVVHTENMKIKVPFLSSQLSFGSSDNCDVVINGSKVADRCAILIKEGQNVYLKPLVKNKVIRKNGYLLNKSTNLTTGSIFYINDIKFELYIL